FTIGRKNWLFSASPKGAAASAAVYSVVETCKANGIAPFKYLVYLFERSLPLTFF
ncbi:MAG TPA: IS66 family transposase, partial [Selenomonas sp.]|nr:IS66 family transposase [Selenomonas sp.]